MMSKYPAELPSANSTITVSTLQATARVGLYTEPFSKNFQRILEHKNPHWTMEMPKEREVGESKV